MKLILATQNKNKVIELKRLLSDYPHYEVLSLSDINIVDDIEETGTTFESNAKLKAMYIHKLTGYACIADDSGIEIEALNNEPGVYSARYLGENTSYEIKNKTILDRLENSSNRNARFVSVVCLILSDQEIHTFEGIMPGSIGFEPRGNNGFGYDPIFVPKGYELSYAEMDIDTKNQLSHRGQALRKAVEYLEKRNRYEK
ncbi:MAG TPA: RdgB/HAM1 family non-canonical purine NTP pyrophosphatase [Erysipelotrichaceae bacterium]|nr:RdgB/HAM1 family non-canonical purine NTP pyrophosphatase [Erysipelotrichaceae bacterium]